jgi:hypothetical protein
VFARANDLFFRLKRYFSPFNAPHCLHRGVERKKISSPSMPNSAFGGGSIYLSKPGSIQISVEILNNKIQSHSPMSPAT